MKKREGGVYPTSSCGQSERGTEKVSCLCLLLYHRARGLNPGEFNSRRLIKFEA